MVCVRQNKTTTHAKFRKYFRHSRYMTCLLLEHFIVPGCFQSRLRKKDTRWSPKVPAAKSKGSSTWERLIQHAPESRPQQFAGAFRYRLSSAQHRHRWSHNSQRFEIPRRAAYARPRRHIPPTARSPKPHIRKANSEARKAFT